MEPGWKEALLPEMKKPYMSRLLAFLDKETAAKKTIYPPAGQSKIDV